ncbi:hypothetical protein GW17_00034656 [Ensete ventricosum]|nr:hypothetical protein GW17_00034656 [Ensete ventricosum]
MLMYDRVFWVLFLLCIASSGLATGRYQAVLLNRPSMVDFGHWRSIKGEIDYRRSIEEEKGKRKKKKKKKRKRRNKKKRRRRNTSPVGDFSPRAGREIEATIANSPLVILAIVLLLSGSNSLRAGLHLQPIYDR